MSLKFSDKIKLFQVNCVVMKGFNEDEVLDFVDLTKDREVDIRFIEYMPFTGNQWRDTKMMSFKEMMDVIKQNYADFQPLENKPNDTSKVILFFFYYKRSY